SALGTVLVEANAELQLTDATTIEGGKITNHGEIESVLGTTNTGANTILNVTSGHFTNDGTIEVVGTDSALPNDADGAFLAADIVPTLVLDGDYLTNFTGPSALGT